MKSKLAALALLVMMSVAVGIPAVQATPIIDQLKVTIAVKTPTTTTSGTAVIAAADVNGDGLVTVTVSPSLLAQIKGGFGATSFAFPGTFTGTFKIESITTTVTLQSTDHFTLKFVSA